MHSQRIVPVIMLAAAALLVGGPAQAAPTLISSLPFTISQPGAYQLTGNLTYTGAGDAILITASNVTLTGGGFTLTGPGGNTTDGIQVKTTSQVTITGVRLTGLRVGILLESANFNSLSNNTATANGEGFRLQGGCNRNTLINNVVSGNDTGIDMNGDDNTLTSNTASNNGQYGILLESASRNTLHGNITNSNGKSGISLDNISNSNILDTNTTNNNKQLGILVLASRDNTLHGNTASFNQDGGIELGTASGNGVRDNNVNNNPVGIDVDADSPGNTLVHNSAQGNTMFDLVDSHLSLCQNGWANNLYVTDNEVGLAAGPMFGCIR